MTRVGCNDKSFTPTSTSAGPSPSAQRRGRWGNEARVKSSATLSRVHIWQHRSMQGPSKQKRPKITKVDTLMRSEGGKAVQAPTLPSRPKWPGSGSTIPIKCVAGHRGPAGKLMEPRSAPHRIGIEAFIVASGDGSSRSKDPKHSGLRRSALPGP